MVQSREDVFVEFDPANTAHVTFAQFIAAVEAAGGQVVGPIDYDNGVVEIVCTPAVELEIRKVAGFSADRIAFQYTAEIDEPAQADEEPA